MVEASCRQIYSAAPKVERVLRTRLSSSEKPVHLRMFDFVVYLLYRGGAALVAALPLPFLFGFGEFLGVCAWWPSQFKDGFLGSLPTGAEAFALECWPTSCKTALEA